MRTVPKPNPPIEKEGLEHYLNRTADYHNGYGYDEFVKRVTLGEPKTVIARAFNVVTHTIYRWLKIYNKGVKNEGANATRA